METAVFGGGCFWCTEAVFEELKGVNAVESGYAGGSMDNPSYEDVSGRETGHAEVIKVEFDPNVIAYRDLLDVFFSAHDPTTMNRQGNDVGNQYRSVIFYTTPEQKKQAEDFMRELAASGKYKNPIVTELKPLEQFYKAETHHQNFYKNNQESPYCQVIINPKINKLKKEHGGLLKNP